MIRVAVLTLLVACSHTDDAPPPSGEPLVNTAAIDDFRTTERAALKTFNDALGRQRANQIDETGLADAIERDVLPPWHQMRARVDLANVPPADREMYATLVRYIAERETAWRAYVAGLRSTDDKAAAPHYAKYHEQNDAADADARKLGEAFSQLR
ncbi:MAG: hypothetical protein QM831_14725 [Kofleriaceae bacterium]